MEIDVQLATAPLREKLRTEVEREILSIASPGVDGIRSLPFGALGSLSMESGVVDHLRLQSVQMERARRATPAPFPIRLPPRSSFPGLPIPSSEAEPRVEEIPVPPVLVRCVFGVGCVRLRDLREGGTSPTPLAAMTEVQVRVTLIMEQPTWIGSTVRVGFRLEGVEVGMAGIFPDPGTLGDEVEAGVSELTQRIREATLGRLPRIELPLGAVASQVGPDHRLWNAGFTLNAACLTIRLQFGAVGLTDWGTTGATWVAAWQDFFRLPPPSRLGDRHWGVFLPSAFLARRIEGSVAGSFAGRTDVSLSRDAPPRSRWSVVGTDPASVGPCHPGGQARIRTEFGIRVHGACIPWGFDMGAHVSLDMGVSMPRAGTLRLDVTLGHEVDHAEAALCAILNSTLLALATFTIGGALGGWVGAAIGGAVGGVTGGVATLAVIYTRTAGNLSREDFRQVEGTENQYYVEVELGLPTNPFLGNLRVSELVACEDGLTMRGVWTERSNRHAFMGELELPGAYRWVQEGSGCPAPGTAPVLSARALLRWSVAGPSSLPLRFWGSRILTSTPLDYPRRLTLRPEVQGGTLRVGMEHSAGQVPPLLREEAPGFELLLQTNHGARLVRVPGPGPEVSEAARQAESDRIVRWCRSRQDLMEAFEDRAGRLRDVFRERLPIPGLEVPGLDLAPQAGDLFRWSIGLAGLAQDRAVLLGTAAPKGGLPSAEVFQPGPAGALHLRLVTRDPPEIPVLMIRRASGPAVTHLGASPEAAPVAPVPKAAPTAGAGPGKAGPQPNAPQMVRPLDVTRIVRQGGVVDPTLARRVGPMGTPGGEGKGDTEERRGRGQLGVSLQVFRPVGRVSLPGGYRDHALGPGESGARLLALTDEWLVHWALGSEREPRMEGAHPNMGWERVAATPGEGVLAWGPTGVWYGDPGIPWRRVDAAAVEVWREGDALVLRDGQGLRTIPLASLRPSSGPRQGTGAPGGGTAMAQAPWALERGEASPPLRSGADPARGGHPPGGAPPPGEPSSSVPFRWHRKQGAALSMNGDALEILELVGTAVG